MEFIFEIGEMGEHVLLLYNWGGAFEEDRGGLLVNIPDALYRRRASSNGGGYGYDYCILPVGYSLEYSVDDF